MKHILFLFGGCSSEHEVSLHSAQAVLANLDTTRYRALMVGITREGQWLYYTGAVAHIGDGTWETQKAACIPCVPMVARDSHALMLMDGTERRLFFDAVFPVLHGKNGEDGTLQGFFELTHTPIIGCGMVASALCMDKDRAHRLVALEGIRVPQSRIFGKEAALADIEAAAQAIGWPLFVKPVRAGSSFGISKVMHAEALQEAVEAAFAHDDTIILEEAIAGFEVGCAVMGTDSLMVGRVDEIELSDGFFDFEEKYTLKTSAIHCPARISDQQAALVQETAKRIYRALDCRVFARVDMFLTPEGEIVFNEVNTIPGFTDHSRYPNMMKAAGISFKSLITRLIELGVRA